MSDEPPEPELPPKPVDVRLSDLLEPLRAQPPRSDPGMALVVARRARTQRGVRGALQLAGMLASAVADVAGLFLGRRKRGREGAR